MAKSALMPNWRHLFVKVHAASKQMGYEEAKKEMMKCLAVFFGVNGLSELQASVERYDDSKREFTIRVLRGKEKELAAGLALIGEFSGVQARMETLKISGTIRSIDEKEQI
jgi:RNase P/RNase MRP subunit POP5